MCYYFKSVVGGKSVQACLILQHAGDTSMTKTRMCPTLLHLGRHGATFPTVVCRLVHSSVGAVATLLSLLQLQGLWTGHTHTRQVGGGCETVPRSPRGTGSEAEAELGVDARDGRRRRLTVDIIMKVPPVPFALFHWLKASHPGGRGFPRVWTPGGGGRGATLESVHQRSYE